MVNPWHLIVVLFGAAIAFAASITYVLVLGADGQTFTERSAGESAGLPDRKNCDDIYGTAYRSNAERDWFTANCSAWAASVGSFPEENGAGPSQQAGPQAQPSATPAPKTPPPEGRDCNQIRGTAYRSPSERDWYLANCQGNVAQAQATPPAGPDRTDCNQIRGTPYRSDSERLWFQANCSNQARTTTPTPQPNTNQPRTPTPAPQPRTPTPALQPRTPTPSPQTNNR